MMNDLPTIDFEPDDAWSLLSNVRRRRALLVVDDATGTIDVVELAKRIAAYEVDAPIDNVEHQQWRRVYVTLLSSHLSTLSQANLIEYDVDEKTISAVGATADVTPWIRALNTACEDADDFPPARCDQRDGGPIVLG